MSKSKYGSIPGACSPAVLIQLADPNFYDFLRFNCLLGRFKTARGEEMTILLPDSKRVAFLKGIKDERVLLHEIDSLIIPQKIPSLGSFAEGFVNKAGIKVAVDKASDKEVTLKNGCKIKPSSPEHNARESKKYFIAYSLSGAAPFEGEKATEEQKKKKVGGSFMTLSGPVSFLDKVQKKVEKLYKNPFSDNAGKNAYFRKVFIQLRILQKNKPELFANGDILRHLGNEEISTSYLLDLVTDRHCAEELYHCLGGDGPCPDRIANIGFAEFVEEYNKAVGSSPPPREIDANRQSEIFRKINSHLDARIQSRSIYKDDLNRLGKDMFIHFTNIMKYRWLSERKECIDNGGSLEHLENETFNSYIIYIKWYLLNNLASRTEASPNVEDDFRDYVGLWKTDTLLFAPTQISATEPFINTAYEKVRVPPAIPEKKLYSGNYLALLLSSTGGLFLGGGNSKVDETLNRYL